uniref:Uncharacterized protein n=1 Tax=Anguilla anguilla TaxID=7936 RepID=A0A0E9VNI1_ANGAN
MLFDFVENVFLFVHSSPALSVSPQHSSF